MEIKSKIKDILYVTGSWNMDSSFGQIFLFLERPLLGFLGFSKLTKDFHFKKTKL